LNFEGLSFIAWLKYQSLDEMKVKKIIGKKMNCYFREKDSETIKLSRFSFQTKI
jgi:hypothetical protein